MENRVSELCKVFFDVENRFELFDWRVRGIALWEAARFATFCHIAEQTGVLDAPTSPMPPGLGQRLRSAARFALQGVSDNPLRGEAPLDAMIFESGRAVRLRNRWVCPYTFRLADAARHHDSRILLMDRQARGQPGKSPDSRRRQLGVIELPRALAIRAMPGTMPRAALEHMAAVDRAMSRALERPVTTAPTLKRSFGRFVSDRAFYSLLLRKHRPKALFCVAPYANLASLICAAREQGIRTIELQHGVISRFHLGYSFRVEDFDKLVYFPDQLYTWGAPWDDLMDFPVPRERRVTFGYPYFEEEARRLKEVDRKPGTMLVISQGTIGRQLAEIIHEHASALRGYRIVFKLHPAEWPSWRDERAIVRLQELPNVRITEREQLYGLMRECEWQVGVYSTALYEGHVLGLKTALVDLPGIEHTTHWLARGLAISFQDLLGVRVSSTQEAAPARDRLPWKPRS